MDCYDTRGNNISYDNMFTNFINRTPSLEDMPIKDVIVCEAELAHLMSARFGHIAPPLRIPVELTACADCG